MRRASCAKSKLPPPPNKKALTPLSTPFPFIILNEIVVPTYFKSKNFTLTGIKDKIFKPAGALVRVKRKIYAKLNALHI